MSYLVMIISSVLLLLNLYIPYQQKISDKKVLGARTEKIVQMNSTLKQIAFWEDFVQKNPTYRDGYVQLALLYNYLGEIDTAKNKVSKIIDLDPNYSFPADFPSLLLP